MRTAILAIFLPLVMVFQTGVLQTGLFRTGHAEAFDTEHVDSEHYRLRVVTVADGLDHPWSLAWLPDGRMLVTERPGRMRLVTPEGELSDPLGGLPKIAAGGQGGLLDVLVDPAFDETAAIYFTYAEPGPRGRGTAAARAVLDGMTLRDTVILFRQVPKSGGGRHFGSRLALAGDGTLFITIGDRGEREKAQSLSVNRGQVLRVGTDGRIPQDNPFAGGSEARPEIWSYGHRNPQGAAIHPVTGALWIHEHGARGGDEINIPAAGLNYGWPRISYGTHYFGGKIGIGHAAPGLEQPVHYWDPSIAPSGMAFVTGDRFAKWSGNLLVGALKSRMLVRMELDGATVRGEEHMLRELRERIRDVRQGPDGHIYLLTDSGNGRILRLEPAPG